MGENHRHYKLKSLPFEISRDKSGSYCHFVLSSVPHRRSSFLKRALLRPLTRLHLRPSFMCFKLTIYKTTVTVSFFLGRAIFLTTFGIPVFWYRKGKSYFKLSLHKVRLCPNAKVDAISSALVTWRTDVTVDIVPEIFESF